MALWVSFLDISKKEISLSNKEFSLFGGIADAPRVNGIHFSLLSKENRIFKKLEKLPVFVRKQVVFTALVEISGIEPLTF